MGLPSAVTNPLLINLRSRLEPMFSKNSNRLLFFENIGSNRDRRFINKGFVTAEGKPIALPHAPVPGSKGVFDDDYHPVPEVVDWDGDGDQDLLLGGYVT